MRINRYETTVKIISENNRKPGTSFAIENDGTKVALDTSWKDEFKGLFARVTVTNQVPGIKFGYINVLTTDQTFSMFSEKVGRIVKSWTHLNRLQMVKHDNDNELQAIETKLNDMPAELEIEAYLDAEEKWPLVEANEVACDAKQKQWKEERIRKVNELLAQGVTHFDVTVRAGYGCKTLWAWNPNIPGAYEKMKEMIGNGYYCVNREATISFMNIKSSDSDKVYQLQRDGWKFWYTDDYTD